MNATRVRGRTLSPHVGRPRISRRTVAPSRAATPRRELDITGPVAEPVPVPGSPHGWPAAGEVLFCSQCGVQAVEGALFCEMCGARIERPQPKLPPVPLYCGQCGKRLAPDTDFCVVCGAPVVLDR